MRFYARRWLIGALMLLTSGAYVTPSGGGQRAPLSLPRRTEDRTKMDELRKLVLAYNFDAIAKAKALGTAANAELTKLSQSKEDDTRLLAVYCLNETGGSEAVHALIAVLLSGDAQASGAALGGLQKHADGASVPALLQTYDQCKDAYVRQQIALLVGRFANAAQAQELHKRLAREKQDEAREGLVTALAKLGYKTAQAEFTRRLHASNNRDRGRYLEYAQYIHQTWLLKPLLPLLDDKSAMVRVGVDARPDLIDHLRACDIAIVLTAKISQHHFSFATDRNTNYTVAQIEEVRAYLHTLDAPH